MTEHATSSTSSHERYKWWDDISRLDIMLRVTKTQVLSDEDRRDGAAIVARLATELGYLNGLLAAIAKGDGHHPNEQVKPLFEMQQSCGCDESPVAALTEEGE